MEDDGVTLLYTYVGSRLEIFGTVDAAIRCKSLQGHAPENDVLQV